MAIGSRYWTLAELKQKIERDTDTEAELFIQPDELLDYINEAIDEAEIEVHGLYEDYFLARATLTLIPDTNEYALPSTIYAHKIRRITYRRGTRQYTVRRVKDWKKFEAYELDLIFGSQTEEEYRYFILNEAAGAPRILFTPEMGDDGDYMTIWFMRQANRLVDDTDILDIPEAANFVTQHVKKRIYEKEGHPNLPLAVADLERERGLLNSILASMVPDADNEIEMDLSPYEEMS